MNLPARWLAGIVVAICGAMLAAAPAAWAQPTIWWQAQLGGLGMDNISDVEVTTSGRVYVAGWQTLPSEATQWVVMAYEPDSAPALPPIPVWQVPFTYTGPWAGQAKPHALVLTGGGTQENPLLPRLAVTGQAPGPDGRLNMVTIILDPDTGERHNSWPAEFGNPDTLGLRRYVGPGAGSTIGRDVDYDFDGNIYAVGPSAGLGGNGQSTGLDYVCIKIEPSGHWSNTWPATATQPEAGVRRYNGPGNGDDIAVQVLAPRSLPKVQPPAHWIYMGGTSWGGQQTQNDVAIVQINKDTGQFGIADEDPSFGWGGPFRYHRPDGFNDVFAEMTFQSEGGGGDLFVALTSEVVWVDPGGNLMAPDPPVPVPTHLDYTTIRARATPQNNSVLAWQEHYNGPAGLDDVAYGIAVAKAEGQDYVYTVGSSQDAAGTRAIKVDRYNVQTGSPAGWLEQHGYYSSPHGHSDGFDIAARTNRILVVGPSTQAGGDRDHVLLKYHGADGTLFQGWPALFGSVQLDDAATLVRIQSGFLNGHRSFVVGGWVSMLGEGSNISIVQWRDDE